jgi:hypothetical protein
LRKSGGAAARRDFPRDKERDVTHHGVQISVWPSSSRSATPSVGVAPLLLAAGRVHEDVRGLEVPVNDEVAMGKLRRSAAPGRRRKLRGVVTGRPSILFLLGDLAVEELCDSRVRRRARIWRSWRKQRRASSL